MQLVAFLARFLAEKVGAQGLHSGAAPFFRFLAFLYLAIVVAESQVLIIAAIMPIFVAALAVSAL